MKTPKGNSKHSKQAVLSRAHFGLSVRVRRYHIDAGNPLDARKHPLALALAERGYVAAVSPTEVHFFSPDEPEKLIVIRPLPSDARAWCQRGATTPRQVYLNLGWPANC